MEVKELGHVVLYVGNIETSVAFYGDLLGWKVAFPAGPGRPVAAFSSGRTHHELLLIEVGEGATPPPKGRHLGMYHIGLKIGDDDDTLRAAFARLQSAGVEISGATDHTISHSLYVADPDGNEVEIFVDVPGVDWKNDPSLIMAPGRPLAL